VTYLVILAFALGLSASVFERPGGLAETTVSEPATRLVYSGPMPALETRVLRPALEVRVLTPVVKAPVLRPALEAPVLTPVVKALTRSDRRVANGVWLAPPIRPQPVSLPDIPDYELIAESKAASIKGQPLLADVQFGPDEPEEAAEARPFMTRLPTPDLAPPTSDGAGLFCDGFC